MKKKDKRTVTQKEIDRLLAKMETIEDQTSEEYKKCMESLERLTSIDTKRTSLKDGKRRLDPNTILVSAISLIELGSIMFHEHSGHIFAGKAFGRILHPRI